jgi:hypothetical protein
MGSAYIPRLYRSLHMFFLHYELLSCTWKPLSWSLVTLEALMQILRNDTWSTNPKPCSGTHTFITVELLA